MIIVSIFIIVIFFLLAGFFSGMETGLISVDRLKLEQDAKDSGKKKQILNFLENPDRLFGTTLFGTNISVVIVSSLSIYLLNYLRQHGLKGISEEMGSLILAGILLIFAEIIPKAVCREKPNTIVPRFFPLLNLLHLLLRPFVKIVALLNSFLLKLFKLPNQPGYHLISREDISYMLTQTEDDGILHAHQREMLEEALEFSELKAENVMIHRTEIVALPQDMPLEKVIEVAKKEGYTRFPVYDQDLDSITGILIIYDLLKSTTTTNNLTAKDFMRKAYFAPEAMDVNKLLSQMQNHKISIAIIVDSFGGTAGLVTVEDILEEIVGEIQDEYDTTTSEIEKLDDNTFLVQGFVEIDFLNDEYEMNLPEGDYETIAGLIIDRLAKIPARNTNIKINEWEIKIVQATSTKIMKVEMTRQEKEPDATA
ncbi:MAG: HlyC/CorC family transporter [Candidatus Cloacimonetes bacterium]|nr:HlyC/CorC family transporter [Candidatus Cloacimonadota bacterium]